MLIFPMVCGILFGMANLITFDMDGTLLCPDLSISENSLSAIRRAAECGKHVALCTGRSVSELRPYLPVLLPWVRFAVCVSGALLYDLAAGKTISSETIDPDTALRAMEIAAPYDPMIHFLAVDSLMQESHWEHLSDFNMGRYTEMYRKEATMVEDLRAFYAARPWPLPKLNFYNRSVAHRKALREAIAAAGLPVEMRDAEISSLELSPPGITKGTGVLSLCRYLGILPEDTVSVGDAENDVDSFRAVGIGVAMGNAPDSVKKEADAVVSDNAHDGCAEAIERFIVNPES